MTRGHGPQSPQALYLDKSTRDKIVEMNERCADLLSDMITTPELYLKVGAVGITKMLDEINATLEAL